MRVSSNENVDMLLDAGDEIEAHWDTWMGGAEFVLGDGTTRLEFGDERQELRRAGLAREMAADALEKAEAHEQELARKHKTKVVGYPTAVQSKRGKDSDAMIHCPFLSHQRKSRRRSTGSGSETT